MKINPAHLLLIFRTVFLLALSLTTYTSLIDTSELPPLAFNVWDKLQHASAFLLLGFLLHHSFPDKRLFTMGHAAQFAFLLTYGVMIEWLQSYTPHREASLGDVVADVFGVLCYALLYYLKNYSGQNSPRRG